MVWTAVSGALPVWLAALTPGGMAAMPAATLAFLMGSAVVVGLGYGLGALALRRSRGAV